MQWRRHVAGVAFTAVFVVSYFTNKVRRSRSGFALKVKVGYIISRKKKNVMLLTLSQPELWHKTVEVVRVVRVVENVQLGRIEE